MRAAIIAEPESICIGEVPVPTPDASQVLVHLEGSGVCVSNLPLWQGRPWFRYSLAPSNGGHEGWGRVHALGRDVKEVSVGERVVFVSDHAYAEFDIASENTVVKLPKESDGTPFPGEPLGCAVNIFRRSDIHAGQTVAIVGIGFLGALLTRLAAYAGAVVIAISRRAFALEIAREFGAAEALPMEDYDDVVSRVRTMTKDRGCERVIEATGLQVPLDLATELTAERGS